MVRGLVVWSLVSVTGALVVTAPATAREERLDWFEQIERGVPDVLVNDVDGGVRPMRRCGAPALGGELGAAVEEALRLWEQVAPVVEEKARRIPVAFHVVHKGQGNLSDAEIQAQIAELDRAYKKFGAKFDLVQVTRKKKGSWYKKCQKLGVFTKMTKALAVDPANTLNIYSCRPGQNLLGFAVPAGGLPETDTRNAVVLHWGTLPGGPLFPYDAGATAVHEVGHYFGLQHTFQNGCSAPGDEVNDTPFEAQPAFGCPVGRDTCPQGGVDPVHNYMDYSDDACLDTFSKGQRKRMGQMLDLFRPNLAD